MAFGEVGRGADPGRRRHCKAAPCGDSPLAFIPLDLGNLLLTTRLGKPNQVSPSLLMALRGSCLGQETTGPEDSAPGTPQLRPPPAWLCITMHPPQLHIPAESPSFLPAGWEMATFTPGYLSVALTPRFPISQWDIDAHCGSFVQAKRSLSLSLFFICICVEDNHSSEGYSHHKSTMTLFSPSLSLSTVLLYN